MKDYSFRKILSQIKEVKFEYREPVKIDLKDKRILYELLKDARIPINEIAKKVRLSRETTRYRIERMIKSGILLGFTTILNLTKLGYSMNFILLELKDLYEDFETELKSFIKKESNILNALKCSGKWDLILITVSESKQEFHNLLTKTRNKCGAHLQDFQTLDVFKRVKYTHLSSGYLEGVKRKDLQDLSVDFPTGGVDIFKYKKEKIDKTDLRILKELLNNARTPVTVIAKNLRLSKDSIHNRLKNLIKKEFINGFMPVINEPVLINYSIHILFLQLKNISNEKFESISNHLKNHPYTLLVFHTGDVYDFFIIPVARSPAHLNEILMIIKSKFSNEIKSHETLLLLDEYKYSEFPQH